MRNQYPWALRGLVQAWGFLICLTTQTPTTIGNVSFGINDSSRITQFFQKDEIDIPQRETPSFHFYQTLIYGHIKKTLKKKEKKKSSSRFNWKGKKKKKFVYCGRSFSLAPKRLADWIKVTLPVFVYIDRCSGQFVWPFFSWRWISCARHGAARSDNVSFFPPKWRLCKERKLPVVFWHTFDMDTERISRHVY